MKKPMKKKIDKAINILYTQLTDIMNENGDSLEDQRAALRIMFSTFTRVGVERNLPIMKETIIGFISEQYPHLKDDLYKLLILS